VHTRVHVSEARVQRELARRGLGIAVLPLYLAAEDIRGGRLVPLLRDYPLQARWLKALVPRMKMNRPVVREFVAFLKHQLEVPPWVMQEQLATPRHRREYRCTVNESAGAAGGGVTGLLVCVRDTDKRRFAEGRPDE